MSTVLSPKTWMTVQEAADFLGVTDGRVRQCLGDGSLKGEKFGKTWAIPRKEVERFAKTQRPVGNPNFRKNGTDE